MMIDFLTNAILSIITVIVINITFSKFKKYIKNFPPSPPPLPIIGHLHLISLPLHRFLTQLSTLHGPTLLLKFGSRPVLVISSPSAVEECFTKHDIIFANRPRFPHTKHVNYNYTALAAISYGPTLRSLRKIAITEILSPARIRSLSPLFDEEVTLMIKEMVAVNASNVEEYTNIDMRILFSELMFNIIMKIITGKRYFGAKADCDLEESKRLRNLIEEMFERSSVANIQDFLPFLKWFGFKKLDKEMARLGKEMDEIFQEMIEERRREKGKEEATTVIDVFLSLQESNGGEMLHGDEVIKGFILTLIAAGTHTTSATMEWAMSLMLNHPEPLQKLKDEINNQVGHDRVVNHSDIKNLTYLNYIIKETLRLYPTVPLLLPHESSTECSVSGYNIPANTILLTNAYAIQRDSEIWRESTTFMPERFEDSGLNASKIYFPFGLGRRSCPGEALAMNVVGLVLGALFQCFDWERIGEEEVDMSEGSGLTLPKAKHLKAMYRPHHVMADMLIKL